MGLENRTVLITGGNTKLGLALAKGFSQAGSRVILCGPTEKELARLRDGLRNVDIFACELSEVGERERLAHWVLKNHPELDVLINGEEMHRRTSVSDDHDVWEKRREEISLNLEAPIHLTSLLLPHLKKKKFASIINVSNELAFAPAKSAPVFSATKAALHAFTVALRGELAETSVQVQELILPTDRDPSEASLEEVFSQLQSGEAETSF